MKHSIMSIQVGDTYAELPRMSDDMLDKLQKIHPV